MFDHSKDLGDHVSAASGMREGDFLTLSNAWAKVTITFTETGF